MAHAQGCALPGGIVDTHPRGVAKRHHHRLDTLRPQRRDGDRQGQRRVDTARKAEHDAGKSVLVDVIAHAQHQRTPGGRGLVERSGLALARAHGQHRARRARRDSAPD